MNVSTVAGISLMLLATPSVALGASATAPSGVKSRITSHFSIDGECKAYRVAVDILTPPRNGAVTVESADIVVPPATPRGGQQPSSCVGKTVAGVAIFYQSKAGFVGEDSFKYRRTTPDRPNDRSAGEISYTITVK